MSLEQQFEDIRPYRDEEVKEVIKGLMQDESFEHVLVTLYKDPKVIEGMKQLISTVETVEDFQLKVIHPLVTNIAKQSTKGLSISGFENFDKSKNGIFISNHRDIILDPAFLNIEFFNEGMNTTEIAIGSNLLIYPWIDHLVKLNRAFKVKRGIPVKQMLEASNTLSSYIRHSITERDTSVWIAQREGRTKHGSDETQVALLKMLNMSNSESIIEGFKELNLVPLAISYEIEPCGREKVVELLNRKYDPDFKKSTQDDLDGMANGITDQKGRVHFQFGKPVSLRLEEAAIEKNKNKQLAAVAKIVDEEIYRNYKLWPNNFIAYDLLNETDKYADRYTEEEKEAFQTLTDERLAPVVDFKLEARDLWCEMYAAPVRNWESVTE